MKRIGRGEKRYGEQGGTERKKRAGKARKEEAMEAKKRLDKIRRRISKEKR